MPAYLLEIFSVYNNRGATPATHEAQKVLSHKAFRVSFTLAASLYIGPADPALSGDFPLGMGSLAAETVAEHDDFSLPGGQAGLDALPHFFTGVPGVQFLQHVVIHRDHIHQGERVPVAARLQRIREGDLSLQLLLGPEVHQDLIFDAAAGVGGQSYVFVHFEGGDPLDESDGPDGDEVVLLPGLGIVFFGRVKQKEEFSRSKTTP